MLLVLLVTAALLLAYANGANDNVKATATLYGSGTIGYPHARALATIAQLTGSAASVALAAGLLTAFGGKGLVPDAVVGDPAFLVSVGLGAGGTVLLATFVGGPISTTHALVGGLAGAGIALAPGDLVWSALAGSYFAPLLLSPFLAIGTTALLYPLFHGIRKRLGVESDLCICVGTTRDPVDISGDGSMVLRRTGVALTIDQQSACRAIYAGSLLGISFQGVLDRLHMVSGFALGFARGLNDTPKVLALLVAAGWLAIDPRWALCGVAFAMALGGWLSARRVAETLAHRITSLTHGQGLLANAVGSGLVIGASLLGSPVSTTHVSAGAIFGIGIHSRTDWRVVATVVFAWVVTLPLAAILAAGTAFALATLH